MAWTSKFSGLPTLTDIPTLGDVYIAGLFRLTGDGLDRTLTFGTAPIAYETLASIGASISNILRVTSRISAVDAGFVLGGGSILYGPDRTDQSIDQVLTDAGNWQAYATENGTNQTIGTATDAGATVWVTRIYWNGSGSAFVIPDAGFGSWSVAANTQSAWYSKDDGTTWVRLGDRAIDPGVAPTRVGIGAIKNLLGDKTVRNVTFSSLEVMEEAAGPPPPEISNRDPGPDAWTLDPGKNISFDITDADDNIDLSTLEITIDVGGGAVAAYTSGGFVSPYNGAGSAVTAIANGYHVVIDRTSDYADGTVTPRVVVEDLDANVLDVSWTFTVKALVDHTLWALGSQGPLWFSLDYGDTWLQVDTSGLSNWLNGLWGPTSDWKVYVGVADDGTYYYDATGWHLEDANGPWWNAVGTRPDDQTLWCSDDDSLVCAAGWSSSYHNVIRTRPGLPGTAWVTEYDDGAGDGYFNDIHGAADGSAVYAIRSYVGVGNDVQLLRRAPGGTWSVVASITDGNIVRWQQVRVISDTEVWITGAYQVGGTDLVGRIWKWNGSTLSIEYEETLIRYNGIVGLWMAKDGTEGRAIFQVDGPAPIYATDYYLLYNGTSWSVEQGCQYGVASGDITQRDGIPASAIAMLVRADLRKYDGAVWDDTYNYSYPSPGNVIWNWGVDGTSLILRYLEYAGGGTAPILQNQTPSPNSHGNAKNTPIYLEIYDEEGDLDVATVVIKVNGDIAWTGDTPATGFSGFKVAITKGYAYTIVPWEEFLEGEQTVQALAEDDDANAMDETYSFWTVLVNDAWSCIKENFGFGLEPFGEEPFGGGMWCVPIEEVYLGQPTELSAKYLTAIDFPLRFTSAGDVVLTIDEDAEDDDLNMSVFVRRNGIPLFQFGAGIEELVFDPLDFATEVFVSDKVATSVAQGNENLRVLEEDIVYRESEDSKLSAAVPYINLKTGRGRATLLAIPRQRTDQ